MFPTPVKHTQKQDSLAFQIEEYRKFLQNKIQELDKNTNLVLCRVGEYFFDCSQKVKTDIFYEWKKVHESSTTYKDIQESIYQIEYSVNTVIDKEKNLQTHTKQVLQKSHNNKNINLQQSMNYSEEREQKQQKQSKNFKVKPKLDDQILQHDETELFITDCPICQKQLSNGQTFVKHLRLHEIDLQSQGFDCPQCDVTFSQCNLLLSHLYKKHYVVEEYQQTKRKSYYCTFTHQKFFKQQSAQLSHIIRSSPHYSKALDQLLQTQLQQKLQKNNYPITDELKLQIKYKMPNQPNYDVEFIRGVTKGIQINKRLYACPLCGLEEFKTLKYVGGHIRNAHRVIFRNNLYCPECQRETRSAHDLAIHLICIHGVLEENSQGGRRQVYTTVGGIQYDDLIKLSRHLMNDEEYLTFFNSRCSEQPFALLKIKENEEDRDFDLSKNDSN